MKRSRVTVEMLEAAGACEVERFKALWPDGATLTMKNAEIAVRELDVDWFVDTIMSPPARAAYYNARAKAWAACDKACAPAWAAYDKARAQARAAYKKACAPAWAAYEKACAQAWAACDKARAEARAAYHKARAEALLAACRIHFKEGVACADETA
ncbi:MAG TPA: hypothetical protein VNA25_09840 [Phycisphaerae bacterium]|nr:hypothetical protein [Phycisphaerae bacterium]